jgi:hypothetical protein
LCSFSFKAGGQQVYTGKKVVSVFVRFSCAASVRIGELVLKKKVSSDSDELFGKSCCALSHFDEPPYNGDIALESEGVAGAVTISFER